LRGERDERRSQTLPARFQGRLSNPIDHFGLAANQLLQFNLNRRNLFANFRQ
jgi:hypothetical protein